MIKSILRAITKVLNTRPQCPVDKKWCAHYDGIYCTFDSSCKVLNTHISKDSKCV